MPGIRGNQPDFKIIAELTILHELSAFAMAESKEQLLWELIEKTTRFFGTTCFAVVAGNISSQELVASYGINTLAEALAKMQGAADFANQLLIKYNENTPEQHLLFFEQLLPIDSRTMRLYSILARRFEDSFVSIQLRDKKDAVEEALRTSESQMRALLSATPAGLILIKHNNVQWFNQSLLRILKCTEDGFRKKLSSLIIPSTEELLLKCFSSDSSAAVTGVWEEEKDLELIDGSRVNLLLRYSAIDQNNPENGFIVLLDDMTGRKKTEQQIREAVRSLSESQGMLRTVLDTIPVRVFWKDASLRYLGCNKLFAKDAGFEFPAELIGKDDFQFCQEEQALRYRAEDQEVILTGLGKYNYENSHTEANGKTRFLKTSKVPLHNRDNQIIGVLGAYEDVTEITIAEREKEKLQLELVQSQKMESVGRLAGGIAHDFNNKLGIIIGYAEMALTAIDVTDPLYADLNIILEAAKNSAELTKQLLSFARRQSAIPKVINLNEVIVAIISMLQRLIGENIQLVWHPGQDIWNVKIDPVQIDRILANLCVNARDAIEQNGRIAIETENVVLSTLDCESRAGLTPGEYVMITFSDNGCGIDEEFLDKVFEPFFTTKSIGHGTGLGLATVYGIVKQNSGFIYVYSAPMSGTTFRIYLPRHTERVCVPRTRVLGLRQPFQKGWYCW
ncbi:MAG: PAS/PAC sensor hybrid histidine kinase [uncultured bacterium]|nr:MAG: PAS/PAC sensor hybrid histidine kinase [uncultured bacterium]